MSQPIPLKPKDPGHNYAETKHISFTYYGQTESAAPFGYNFFVSVPPLYEDNPHKKWPLVVFLHGAGESQRGPDESYASLRHGVPKLILCYDKLIDGSEPSIAIPKASRLRGRGDKPGQSDLSITPVPSEVCCIAAEEFITITPVLDMDNGYGWNPSVLTSLLDTALPNFNVDLSRIHLTGFSMGGYGTWALALSTPNRFATLTPICGGGDALRARHIAKIPQWVHHGVRDDVIPVSASKKMVDALKAAGGDVQFTQYPDLSHDSWTAAYNNIDLWKWMLETRKKKDGELEHLPKADKAPVA